MKGSREWIDRRENLLSCSGSSSYGKESSKLNLGPPGLGFIELAFPLIEEWINKNAKRPNRCKSEQRKRKFLSAINNVTKEYCERNRRMKTKVYNHIKRIWYGIVGSCERRL